MTAHLSIFQRIENFKPLNTLQRKGWAMSGSGLSSKIFSLNENMGCRVPAFNATS